MKFIITDFFEKFFNKNVSDFTVNDLVKKININSKNFIYFKQPFVKVKIRTNTKSYRILLVFDYEDSIILFLNIFDKKDKNYGDNLSRILHKNDIILWRNKSEECLKSGKYYKIEI